MRKIDKNIRFSTVYKAWLEDLEAKGKDHPNYPGNREFYYDVKFELLRCQRGLCAYTEIELCEEDILTADNWTDGRYDYDEEATQASGHIEHFAPKLKPKKGWLWSNLFMVDNHINTPVKGSQEVDDIMKPDADDYDPKDRLEFDSELNTYLPNDSKTPEEQERIKKMIKVLGLNFGHVKRRRKSFIKKLKERIEDGTFKAEAYEGEAFPTAFDFVLEEMDM